MLDGQVEQVPLPGAAPLNTAGRAAHGDEADGACAVNDSSGTSLNLTFRPVHTLSRECPSYLLVRLVMFLSSSLCFVKETFFLEGSVIYMFREFYQRSYGNRNSCPESKDTWPGNGDTGLV
jgi:hypothetical protein